MDIIYTDGSCLGNPGKGGFAVVFPDGNVVSRGYRQTTNNRMELMALIYALNLTEGNILVRTDSQYVVNSVKQWLNGWVKTGWKGGTVKNMDLWKLYLACRRPFEIEWVKGHVGNPLNELADKHANAAAGFPEKMLNIDEGFENGETDASKWIQF